MDFWDKIFIDDNLTKKHSRPILWTRHRDWRFWKIETLKALSTKFFWKMFLFHRLMSMTDNYLLCMMQNFICKLCEVQSTMCHIKLISFSIAFKTYLFSIFKMMNFNEKWARDTFANVLRTKHKIWKQRKVTILIYSNICHKEGKFCLINFVIAMFQYK